MQILNNLLKLFKDANKEEIVDKEKIVERLLANNSINAKEAVTLLRAITIEINSDKIEVSSGAKITGGSELEYNVYD